MPEARLTVGNVEILSLNDNEATLPLRGCVTIGFSPPFEPFPIQREGTQFAVIQVSPRDQEDLSHTL